MMWSPKIVFLGKVLLCCGIALLSALFVIRYRTRSDESRPLDVATLVREDGFNFDVILNGKDWIGPKVGESIDTSKMRSRSGQPLSEAIKGQELSMLIVVDPACGTCTTSASYMRQVRDQMAKQHIPYYVAGFVPSERRETFYDYADLLHLDSASYYWDQQTTKVPINLEKMIVPTHLLIDSQQTVRGLWPGGGPNALLTDKMLQQITADVTRTSTVK